jgi:hypothetical protein
MFTDEKAHFEHRFRHYWRIVHDYPGELECVPEKYMCKKFALMAVKRRPELLALVPVHLRNAAMARVVMAANPSFLHHLVPHHLMTVKLVKLAVKKEPFFLHIVYTDPAFPIPLTEEELREIWESALLANGSAVANIPWPMRTADMYKIAVRGGYNPWHICSPHTEKGRFLKKLVDELALSTEMKEELIAATGDVAYYFRNCLSSAELEEQQLTQADLCQLPFKDPDFKFGRALMV